MCATLVLFVVGTELLLLRLVLHYFIKLRFQWSGLFTDFDIAIPTVISFYLMFFMLSKGAGFNIKFHKKIFLINIAAIIMFLLLNWQMASQNANIGQITFFWLFNLFIIVVSAFHIFVSAKFYWKNTYSWVVPICFLIAFCNVIFRQIFVKALSFLLPLTSSASCFVLSHTLKKTFECQVNPQNVMLISHPYFPVRIAPGCSGLEAQLFLVLTFLILLLLRYRSYSVFQWFFAYIIGTLLMFVANVARISLIVSFGAWSSRTSFYYLGRELILFLFHSHIGWLFYSLVLVGYLALNEWILSKNKNVQRILPLEIIPPEKIN